MGALVHGISDWLAGGQTICELPTFCFRELHSGATHGSSLTFKYDVRTWRYAGGELNFFIHDRT